MKNPVIKKLFEWYSRLAGPPASRLDFHGTYPRFVKSLMRRHSRDRAMHLAVGGEFEAIGAIEGALLIQSGLAKDGYVIDVGCGSGRLAKPLSRYLAGKYLGIDVVEELVDYARDLVQRPDWRFEIAQGLTIPEEDGRADIVCFFSVFTHLLHEQTYVYLREAKRVLKPGGKIIFSFHEFSVPSHWKQFELNLEMIKSRGNPLSMFIDRDAIEAWAAHLNLQIESIHAGDQLFVELLHPVRLENGAIMKSNGNLGQSVCILSLD